MVPLRLGKGQTVELAAEHIEVIGSSQLSDGVYRCSREHLNTVFKPGAFGGQLMAQALQSAIASTAAEFLPSSQMSAFLGPVLLGSMFLWPVFLGTMFLVPVCMRPTGSNPWAADWSEAIWSESVGGQLVRG